MGQQEVFKFLKDNKNKWFTIRQVYERLDVSIISVAANLRKLRKDKQIECKKKRGLDFNTGSKKRIFAYKFKG